MEDYNVIADDMYKNLMENIYTEKHIQIFVDKNKGIEMPYETMMPSEQKDYTSSEAPKYVEFIICKDDENLREKFAVHKKTPDHPCGKNCKCIEKFVTIRSSKQAGGAKNKDEDEEQEDVFTESDEITEYSPTSDDISTTTTTTESAKKKEKEKKKKEKKEEDDDTDETDEDTEDLEGIDEEAITEDGLILDGSDIHSSDLYRMQSRVFASETDDFAEEGLSTESEYTDKVDKAVNMLKKRQKQQSKLFDTEEKEILNLTSSTDEFMKRPSKKNPKYNQIV